MVNSKDFILKTARDNNIESFFLFRNDPDDPASLIYSGDKPKGMDDKMAELEYHLNCDYGVVYLQMRSKAGLGPVFKNRHDRNCIIFQDKVNLSEQPKAVDPVKPLGNIPEQVFSQSPSLELVRQYEGEKMNMQQTIGQLTTQMAQIEMENRHRFELDRKDREIETLNVKNQSLKTIQKNATQQFKGLSNHLKQLAEAFTNAEKAPVNPEGKKQLLNAQKTAQEAGEKIKQIAPQNEKLLQDLVNYCPQKKT